MVLFRCNWWDVYDKVKGIKIDEYGFVSVNCQRLLKTNEPFVLATQASQVFYVTDSVTKGWHVVQKNQPRDTYTMSLKMDDDLKEPVDVDEAYQQGESSNPIIDASKLLNMDDNVNLCRNDVEPMTVDRPSTQKKRKR